MGGRKAAHFFLFRRGKPVPSVIHREPAVPTAAMDELAIKLTNLAN